MKQVLVTTKHRGVFAGEIPDTADLTATSLPLTNARMAIYWSSGVNGVMGLAETGPNSECRISARADIPMLHDITAIFDITPEAWAAWTNR